jgi:hypothetical protein
MVNRMAELKKGAAEIDPEDIAIDIDEPIAAGIYICLYIYIYVYV